MNLIKQNFAKSSILLLVILIMINLFSLGMTARAALPATDLNKAIRQVKTADSSTVYYLDHARGLRKAYVSETAFLSYGHKWSDIIIISQEQLDKWPEMNLAKTKDLNQVYYISHGQKALIESEQQFMDNGFAWRDILTLAAADLNEYELSTFDTVRVSLGDRPRVGAPATIGLLKISLLPINQTALFIPTGSRANLMGAFRFEAAGQDAKINSLTFTQQGVSTDDLIDAVYLVDEDNMIYGQRQALINKHFYVNLSNQPLIIPAGQTKILYLKADLKAASGISGQTLKFGIINALDIAANSQLAAVFPIFSPEFRLADGAGSLGKLKISPLALSANGDRISLGANNQAVAAFRFAETSGYEDILIKKIIFTNLGSTQDGDLRNLTLIDQTGTVIMRAQTMVNRQAVFIMEPGYLIKQGRYADLMLKVNVAGGVGREVKFVINDDSEAVAAGKNSNYYLTVVNELTAAGANKYTIIRSPLFLTAGPLKPNESSIYRDQPDAVLGSFELRNDASDIKLYSFTLSIIKSAGAADLDQPLAAFDSKTGARLGQAGSREITNNFGEMVLGNYPVGKNKTLAIKFKTHVPDAANSGDSYQIFVKKVNYHVSEDNILYQDNPELLGQESRIVRPTLNLYSGQAEERDLAVAGDHQVNLGFFKAEATKEKNIRITSLTIANTAGFTPVNYDRGFTNLALYRAGSKVSHLINQPNGNSYTFENLSLYIGAGSSVNLSVRADLARNTTGQVKLILESATAKDYVSGRPAEVINQNAVSPAVAITQTALTIASLSGGAAARGQKNNQIASFTFINQAAEKIKLGKIVLNSSGLAGDLSANNGFRNLRFGYIKDNGRIAYAGSRLSGPVAGINEINLNGFILKPAETITLNLYVDADQSAAGGAISLFIRSAQARGYFSNLDFAASGAPTEPVEAIVN